MHSLKKKYAKIYFLVEGFFRNELSLPRQNPFPTTLKESERNRLKSMASFHFLQK